jgi:hypothetical protein
MAHVLSSVRHSISFYCLQAALLLCPVILARAQTYGISWYKVAGGGGSSSGGGYTVTGTIGQPDTGNLSGGGYSLTGGFWSIIATVPTPGSPPLTIASVTATQVQLSWPVVFSGFRVQQDSSLGNTNWLSVNTNSYPVTVTNGSNTVTIPISGGNQYFRLVTP